MNRLSWLNGKANSPLNSLIWDRSFSIVYFKTLSANFFMINIDIKPELPDLKDLRRTIISNDCLATLVRKDEATKIVGNERQDVSATSPASMSALTVSICTYAYISMQ